MNTRPKRTKPDANQPAERAKLIGWGYVCVDTHNLPGNETGNPLDEYVMSPPSGPRVWLQVEWKTGPGATFTDNEEAYFKHLGIWDIVQLWLDPALQWRQHGVPVVVAWTAEQIVDVFVMMRLDGNLRANAGT